MSSTIHESMSVLPGESGTVAEALGEAVQVSSGDPLDVSAAGALTAAAAFHFTGTSASANGATMQEYFVQSVVSSEQQHDLLLTRLRGLSHANAEFCDQEISLRLISDDRQDALTTTGLSRPSSAASSSATSVLSTAAHAASNPTVHLRVRRSLLPIHQLPDRRMSTLRYLGAVETDKFVSRRSCLIVPVAGPLLGFLQELGFEPEHTYVAEGHMFVRGRAKVSVYTVNHVTQFENCAPGLMENVVQDLTPKEWRRICPRSWLVEISAVGCPADESLQEEVAEFTDLLYPLIVFGKTDPAGPLRK